MFAQLAPQPDRKAAAAASFTAHRKPLQSREGARRWLNRMILPPSMRWAFASIGKSASTTTLRFLFKAEYGTELTARYDSRHDINPGAVVHQLAEAGVFARAYALALDADALVARTTERICVVRDPAARALSAFAYLCRSDREASPWFLTDRLRLNAFGFDWTRHPDTAEGLRIFLDFIEAETELAGVQSLNPHWIPQTAFVLPGLFQPTLIGRMEALPEFFAELAQRLDQPAPTEIGWENRQSHDDQARAMLDAPGMRARIEQVYATDYARFGY